jgi:outer membrane protein assembly factor BamB
VKLSGTDGAVHWRRVLTGGGDEVKLAIAADGGVVVAGSSPHQKLSVAKLSGADGAVIWRRRLGKGRARTVAIVPSGAAVIGLDIGRGVEFAVTKLSAPNGTPMWRRTFRGSGRPFYDPEEEETHRPTNSVASLVVAPRGDVIAAGVLENTDTGQDFVVIKLAGTTGDERWRRVLKGTGFDYRDDRGTTRHVPDYATAVAVDAERNVVAVGFISTPDSDFGGAVVKLSPRDGHRLWRTPLSDGVATAVAVDSAGHPVVAARDSLLSVVKLRADTGEGF